MEGGQVRKPKFKMGDNVIVLFPQVTEAIGSFSIAAVAEWTSCFAYQLNGLSGRWYTEDRLELAQDPYRLLRSQMENDLQRFEEAKADLLETSNKVAKSTLPEPERTIFFRALGHVMEWDNELKP